VAAGLAQGGDAAALEAAAAGRLVQEGFRIDYLEARDAETLAPPAPGRPLRVFGAAWLGATRLIDNVPAPTPAARG
jgi:pantoate--beta-alanine ligase